jgi:thioesterase domain-containing protein
VNFFEAGGSSLLALQVIGRLSYELGADVSLGEILAFPSPVALAAHLIARPAADRADSYVVELSPKGNGLPLVCVHPIGGSVGCYAGLAEELSGVHQVLAIEARPHPGSEDPQTISDLAQSYLTAVDERLEGEAFMICGWSFGGFVAYEMSRQIAKKGLSCPIVLVDAYRSTEFDADARDDQTWRNWYLHDALTSNGAPTDIQSRVEGWTRSAAFEERVAIFRRNVLALAGYQLEQSSEAGLVLDAGKNEMFSAEREPDWGDLLIGKCLRRAISADHYGILKTPAVRNVASAISEFAKL